MKASEEPTPEEIEQWRKKAARINDLWKATGFGKRETLYDELNKIRRFNMTSNTFNLYMQPTGRWCKFGDALVDTFCELLSERLPNQIKRNTSKEELAEAIFRHICYGEPSPLEPVFSGGNSEPKSFTAGPNPAQTVEEEQRSAELREIDALSSSELKNKQSNAKKEPEIRIIPFFQDKSNVATLSLEKTGQKDFNSITGELSQLLLAEVFLMPLRYDDGMICFKALAIEVPPDDIVTASKAGVQVDFTKFGAALSNQPLIGCFEDKIEQQVGQTVGVKNKPTWSLDKLPGVPEKGLRVYNIDLGAIFLKFLSNTIDSSFEFEFQAVVDLSDLVWISDSEGNFPVDQENKGEAFDRVLVNKHLKGGGRFAVVSSSVIKIDLKSGSDQ